MSKHPPLSVRIFPLPLLLFTPSHTHSFSISRFSLRLTMNIEPTRNGHFYFYPSIYFVASDNLLSIKKEYVQIASTADARPYKLIISVYRRGTKKTSTCCFAHFVFLVELPGQGNSSLIPSNTIRIYLHQAPDYQSSPSACIVPHTDVKYTYIYPRIFYTFGKLRN